MASPAKPRLNARRFALGIMASVVGRYHLHAVLLAGIVSALRGRLAYCSLDPWAISSRLLSWPLRHAGGPWLQDHWRKGLLVSALVAL